MDTKRLKQARIAAGLSMDNVSDRLSGLITKAAVSIIGSGN